MDSCFDRQEKMLDGITMKMTRGTSQSAASLEHDARQPRLAMEADGPANTKTHERTEGAATAVQAMGADSFSARRVEPGPRTNSTSVGMMAEPPALPCKDDVLVENGDASSKSCLSSLEKRRTTPASGFLPTGKSSTATKIIFNKSPLQFYSTEGATYKYGLQFHPSGTTAASGNCLLPPPAGELLKQNPDKIGRSIQAILKVISAPAYFWERGARLFAVRLCVWERLVMSCKVFFF